MRDCGSCAACCVFVEVKNEMLKIRSCQYLNADCLSFSGNGCSVYESRPKMCRDFQCDYLKGKIDERPDEPRNKWLENMKLGILQRIPDKLDTEGP